MRESTTYWPDGCEAEVLLDAALRDLASADVDALPGVTPAMWEIAIDEHHDVK